MCRCLYPITADTSLRDRLNFSYISRGSGPRLERVDEHYPLSSRRDTLRKSRYRPAAESDLENLHRIGAGRLSLQNTADHRRAFGRWNQLDADLPRCVGALSVAGPGGNSVEVK